MIDLSPDVRASVLDIMHQHLGDQRLYLVGSRARGPAKRFADIDILLMNKQPLSPAVRANLHYDLEESDIPFKVDVLEWAGLSQSFRSRLQQEARPLT
jgi:predicted nucleotidyltransferase